MGTRCACAREYPVLVKVYFLCFLLNFFSVCVCVFMQRAPKMSNHGSHFQRSLHPLIDGFVLETETGVQQALRHHTL